MADKDFTIFLLRKEVTRLQDELETYRSRAKLAEAILCVLACLTIPLLVIAPWRG